jgi:acyl carrier protein
MNLPDVKVDLRSFVVNTFLFGQDDISLQDDDSFVQRGIVDSTGVLELIYFVEEKFGIRVADEELIPENLDSIASLSRFIEAKHTCAAG